jgi:hypothetical protein
LGISDRFRTDGDAVVQNSLKEIFIYTGATALLKIIDLNQAVW